MDGMLHFVMLLWGLVYLWTGSSIFAGLRMLWYARVPAVLKPLAYCPACAGFWVGAVLAAAGMWPLTSVLWAWLDAAVCSAGTMAVAAHLFPSHAWQLEQGEPIDDTTISS